MRRRDLIRKLKDSRGELRRVSSSFLTTAQAQAERRLILLHALENLLPEIIEKLEAQP
jgi:hypothetical protein